MIKMIFSDYVSKRREVRGKAPVGNVYIIVDKLPNGRSPAGETHIEAYDSTGVPIAEIPIDFSLMDDLSRELFHRGAGSFIGESLRNVGCGLARIKTEIYNPVKTPGCDNPLEPILEGIRESGINVQFADLN